MLALAILVMASGAFATGAVSASRTTTTTCPVPDSGTCLGKLAAGTYTAQSFRPKFSFRVSAGWANYLDIPGLYLLQPPGAKPPGNYIAGSFIGLETSVAPEAFDCYSRVRGVRTTPTAITAWITKQPGLVISHRRTVTVGGLHGIALDIKMAHGAKGCLSAGATKPAVPLLVGIGPSSFDHEVAPGVTERHYLLAYKGGTLDIQMVDTSAGTHLASYSAIVGTFRFQP
jgi:hypothetical protein